MASRERSNKLLIRNISSSVTEQELRILIREIDQVDDSNIVTIFVNSATNIALLTFDSEAAAQSVFEILSDSYPLGPNFEPVKVTFVPVEEDIEKLSGAKKDVPVKKDIKKASGTRADSGEPKPFKTSDINQYDETIRNSSSSLKSRTIPDAEGIPNISKKSSGSDTSIGIGRPLKFFSPPARKETSNINKKQHVPNPEKDLGAKVTKSKMKPKKNGSYVLKVKKVAGDIDSETFTFYLKSRKVTFAKMDFMSDDDDSNDDDDNTHTATLSFSNESEALKARDLLKENCAIGIEGTEAEILLDSIDEPYHKDPNSGHTDKQRLERDKHISKSSKKPDPKPKKKPVDNRNIKPREQNRANVVNQPLNQQNNMPHNKRQGIPTQQRRHQSQHGGPYNQRKGAQYEGMNGPDFPYQQQPYQPPIGGPANQGYTAHDTMRYMAPREFNNRPGFPNQQQPYQPQRHHTHMGGPPNMRFMPPNVYNNGQGFMNQQPPHQPLMGGAPPYQGYMADGFNNGPRFPNQQPPNQPLMGDAPAQGYMSHGFNNGPGHGFPNQQPAHQPLLGDAPTQGYASHGFNNGPGLLNQPPHQPHMGGPPHEAYHAGSSNDVRPKVFPKHAKKENKPKSRAGKLPKEDNSSKHDGKDSNLLGENTSRRNDTPDTRNSRGRGKCRNSKQTQAHNKLSSMETDTPDDKISRMFGNVDVQETGESLCDAAADDDDTDSVYSNISSASTQRVHKNKPRSPKATALFVTGLDSLTTKASLESFLRDQNVKFTSITLENKPRGLTAIIKFRNPPETTAGMTGIHGVIMESPNGASNMLKAAYHFTSSRRGPIKSHHPSSDSRSDVGSSYSSRSRQNPPMSTSLKVIGRDQSVDPVLMSNYLKKKKNELKYTNFTFKNDRQNVYAILEFNMATDCSHARSIMHGQPLGIGASPVVPSYLTSISQARKTTDPQRPERKHSSASSHQQHQHPRAKSRSTTDKNDAQSKTGRERKNSQSGTRSSNQKSSNKSNEKETSQECCVKISSIDESVDEEAFSKCLRRKRIKPYNLQWKTMTKPIISHQANLHFHTLKEAEAAAKVLNGSLFGEGDIPVKAELISKADKQSRSDRRRGANAKSGTQNEENDDSMSDVSSVASSRISKTRGKKRNWKRKQRRSTSITVKNIDSSIDEDDFREFLLQNLNDFSELQFIPLSPQNMAIVIFESSEEAVNARTAIQGKILAKRRLQASYSSATESVKSSERSRDDDENVSEPRADDRQPLNKPKGNPNDVLVENIPRFVREAELATLISERKCKGFVNVNIYEDETVTSKRSAKITFDSRVTAVEATAALYGQRLKGYCLEVKLAQEERSGLSKLIAKRKVDELLNEIVEEGNEVASELNTGMTELAIQVYELGTQIEESNSIAIAVSLEAQKTAIEQQIGEIQGYQKEFDQVSKMTKTKLDQLQPQTSEHTDLTRLDDIRQRFLRECRRTRNPLPIYGHKASILETITASDVSACVIRAETGSGKSTQVPQYLIEDDEFLAGSDGSFRKVICTQPRRVAAISLARRVAEEYGCRVGEEVGYIAGQTRNESSRTRVTFMTDRALLNICLADKTDLKNYACVIIDEAHERSVDTDILLAMLKQMQTRRGDLKVVIMSATIDVNLFSNYFNRCPVIDVPGRAFPVDVMYCGSASSNNPTEYLDKAVRKAVEIHRQDDIDGDILVFLTSQNEIERACTQISSALRITNWQDTKQGNVIIIPLHGKLQPDDQMKVFKATPEGKRKIVFATNVAETSVTIPGIKYVIDTGMVKECQYDPQRNMSLLKVTNITQASAEQRKGRAGRTGPGKCYRLFTKTNFDEMAQSMKPEIFRVHLGMAMLQLIQMGIQDVETFDFVESPEKGAIHKAISSLIVLGAVDDNRKLTPLGMKMADLSLEPRLAKLVLTGIENGVGEDAIALASLVSAPGNIIFRGSSEADQQKSEMKKLQFSSEGGDILTMLKIYRIWIREPEKQRTAWCQRNSMNAKTLRAVKENANEIKQNLKKSLKISVEETKEHEGDDNGGDDQNMLLRKLLLSVYFENLSIYNGHPKAGYTIIAQLKTAVIHPSSVLKSMDSLPKWLIYGDLRRTSQDFVCNLTPVESEWIDEMVPKLFRDTIDKDALERNVIREMKIENVGTALMKTLAMKRFERLRALEDDVTKQTNTPCIIEADWTAGSLNVFVSDQGEDYAKQKVKEYLEDEKMRAQREQVEISVGSFGSVRHVIVSGGETGFVLMGDEYRSLDISNVPREVTSDEIIQLCGCQPDQIKQVFKFPSHYSQAKRGVWGRVTFLNPTDAAEVKKRLEETVYPGETEQIIAQPSLPRQNAASTKKRSAIETAVEVTWFLTRSRGFGFVTCDTTADSMSLKDDVNGLPLKGKSIRCELKKDNSRVVYITNIDYKVTSEELESALKRTTRVAFNSAKIIRVKPTGDIKNTTTKKRLRQLFDIDGLKKIDINILDPKFERSQRRKAFVNFDPSFQQEMNEKVQDLQTSPALTDNQDIFHVRMLVTSELYCKERVYELLKDELDEFIDTVEGTGEGIVVKTMTTRNRQERRVQVSGSDYQKVFDVRMALKVLLHGEEVSVEDFVEEQKSSQWVQRALCGLSQGRLNEFHNGDDSKAFIDVDTRRCVIHIHGKEDDREEYKTSLRRYFKSLTDTKPIEMRNINLRALVLKFGPWLEQLKEDQGVEDVTIDLKKRVLLLTVSEAARTGTLDKINDCMKNTNYAAGGREDIECGICFCPAEADEKTYRLLSCGHYFDVNCLRNYLRHQETDKVFPIVCPCEGCAEPFTLVDIRIICPEEDRQNKLFRAALEAFVSQNKQDCLRFCPSPDCCMIYRQSKHGEPWTCTECGKQICSGCGEDVHPGDMTCAEYKISKESSDAVWEWARTQGENVKQCPTQGCGFIDKFEGCNRVTCTQCKKHICWKCLDSFETSGECYFHLNEKHGGCFDYDL